MGHVSRRLLAAAVQAAAAQCGPGASSDAVMASTWDLYRRLSRPTAWMGADVTISRGTTVRAFYQFTDAEGEHLMTAMTMDDTADIVISTTDDHGDPTADQLSWVASDGGANLTLTVSDDTQSAHVAPVAEGTGITVTVTDPSAPGAPAFVASFDIGPGPTSQLVGTVTVNAGANAAPPAGP